MLRHITFCPLTDRIVITLVRPEGVPSSASFSSSHMKPTAPMAPYNSNQYLLGKRRRKRVPLPRP